MDNTQSFDILIGNWDASLPSSLGYSTLNATAQEDITRSINQFYFGSVAAPNNQVDKQIVLNVRKCHVDLAHENF